MGWQSEKGNSDKGNARYADDSARGGRYRDDNGGRYNDDRYRDERNRDDRYRDDKYRDDRYRDDSRGGKDGKGDKGSRKGGWNDGGRQDGKGDLKGEKGDRKGGWQDGKGDSKGEKGDKGKGDKGKGKGSRPERLVSQGLRGKVISFIKDKPSGFIQRADGERDVFFDVADIADGIQVELYDPVEFDVVEGSDRKYRAARIKKCAPEALQEKTLKSTTPLTASKAGSLTSGLSSVKKGSFTSGLSSAKKGSLTGTLSKGGGMFAKSIGKPKVDEVKEESEDEDGDDENVEWARIVSVRERFGFMQRLNSNDKGDVFFRASDVVAMGTPDPGDAATGLEITMPHGRDSQGYTKFYMNLDDEVSFVMSKDHTGKPCAADIRKERKGAWRTGRRTKIVAESYAQRQETVKDQVNRMVEMSPDEVLQNVSLFKDILESPQFEVSHLSKLVSLLASPELIEDDRSDSLYRIFADSSAMQTMLRTAIIRHGAGKHSGNFLEDCLKCLVEIVIRHTNVQSLRGQLPLKEIVEAFETSLREGGTITRGGLSEENKQLMRVLERKMPDEVKLDRLFGQRAKREIRSAADDFSELLEADHYRDMPILPTPDEMLGHCAFEITENMRTYEKCEDFLQTHFMLLREDYVEPLRQGIKLFFDGKHSSKDLHVYEDVKVVGMLSTWEGVCYRIELPKSQVRRINWDKSKQLMYGSLLCLSDDGFENLVWATVWRRDPDMMAKDGQLDVRLPVDPFDDRFSPGKTFYCIENVMIYFEAYRHVLAALQSMRPCDVPFQNVLLSPQPEAVPPGFLKADNDMFHFHTVFENCEREGALVSAPKSFKILQEWPPTLIQALDIDVSQLDAIQHALTHAIALIQGPPGTGKTWVGLKIVKALLENTESMRHSPILVVCYTNHALDQFLEGIYKFCGKIARIGSRSKSEVMKQRNLKELLSDIESSKEYYQARKSLNDRRDYLRDLFKKVTEQVDSHTVSLRWAREHIKESNFEAFYRGFLDYLAEDAYKVTSAYENSDAVDDELWNKMMKAWLDTSRFEKLAPVAKINGKAAPPKKPAADDEDSEMDRKTKETAEDAEEEADQVQNERKLDGEVVPDKKSGGQDFLAEMNNVWLAWHEDVSLGPTWREDADDLWCCSLSRRKDIYRQWLMSQHHEAREELPDISQMLERNADSRAALERDRKLELLREMKIVGMTTTAVSKYQPLLKELRPEVVIVEEAAEVLEAHILTALHPRTQHVILIGDHQQLRPSTQVYKLSKQFNLDVSLFERLIKNGADHVTLLQQRRMHPKISRLIKPLYPKLRDHSSTWDRPEVTGSEMRTFFMRHNKFEDDEGESHSKTNSHEAKIVAALCGHLVRSGYEETQITVLTPYLGQVRTLKNSIRRDPELQEMLITAVDNYQGEENDIIVISLVRSNRNKSMGFLAVDNRINVALTRARCGMFIVGNSDMLQGHPLWTSILNTLDSDGSFGSYLPLINPRGKVVDCRNADDIMMLTDIDYQRVGDRDGDDGPARSPAVVADRWAALGKDDDRGNGGRDNRRDKANDDRQRRDGGGSGQWSGGGGGGGGGSGGQRRSEPSGRELPLPPSRDGDGGGGGGKKKAGGGKVVMKWG